MKKILASVLTAAMMLSMGTAAMAATTNDEGEFVDEETITITKVYTDKNANSVSAEETFSFTIEAGATIDGEKVYVKDAAVGVANDDTIPLPIIGTVKYDKDEATNPGNEKTVEITLPKVNDANEGYKGVGIYYYTIKETAGSTAGVTYYDDEIILVVTVIQDENEQLRVAAVHTEEMDEEEKSDKFENIFSTGSLDVTKTVTGNLGDLDKYFEVTVTFNSPSDGSKVMSDIYYHGGSGTYAVEDTRTVAVAPTSEGWTGSKEVKINLKNGDTFNFWNIPYGVTYTVVENVPSDYTATYEYTGTAYSEDEIYVGGVLQESEPYEVTITDQTIGKDINVTTEVSGVTIIDTVDCYTHHVEITNNKDTNVDTGISVDSIPYIAMLGVVAIGGTGFIVSRKRRSED